MIECELDGRSVLDLVTQGGGGPHEQLFWEYGPDQLAVREGPWKLVLNAREDDVENSPVVHLVNLDQDPGERTNLADDDPSTTARLTEAVQAWRQSDAGLLPDERA